MKGHIREKKMNKARPACVSFISWRFSRVDAMSWIPNTKAQFPLPDLPLEGNIQSPDAIDLPRLHLWMPAIWENVGDKLCQSTQTNDLVLPMMRQMQLSMAMTGRLPFGREEDRKNLLHAFSLASCN